MPAATPLQRYQIMEPLGAGRQGRTFRAVDRDTQRDVAIKVISLRELGGWKDFDRFEREVQTLKSLDHRGIPRFIDSYASEASGDYFLVMELVDGVPLRTFVRGQRRVRPGMLESIFAQGLDVLAYLHGHAPAIVHRDIKPSNLMWTSDERLVLVDFGGVHRVRDGEASTMIGTFGYMAPEQLHGEVTPASDLYAFAATMAALAMGVEAEELPRDGLRVRVEALDLPPSLAKILPQMLEPDPGRRLRSVDAVRAARAEAEPRRRPSLERELPVPTPRGALERLPGPFSVLAWVFAGLGAGFLLVFEVVLLPLLAKLARTLDQKHPQQRHADDVARLKHSVARGREFLGEIANRNRPSPEGSATDDERK